MHSFLRMLESTPAAELGSFWTLGFAGFAAGSADAGVMTRPMHIALASSNFIVVAPLKDDFDRCKNLAVDDIGSRSSPQSRLWFVDRHIVHVDLNVSASSDRTLPSSGRNIGASQHAFYLPNGHPLAGPHELLHCDDVAWRWRDALVFVFDRRLGGALLEFAYLCGNLVAGLSGCLSAYAGKNNKC